MVKKSKRLFLTAGFLLLTLLVVLSIPRADDIISVPIQSMNEYPALQAAYEALCEEYSPYQIVTEENIQIVTVRNLWGSWQRYILPCYTAHTPNVPAAGNVGFHWSLYILAPWSEENMFADLYRLKVRNFSLRIDTDENLFVDEQAELTHANMTPGRQIKYAKLISFSDAVICDKLPTVSVDYSVATNNSALEREQTAATTFICEYDLRYMGKQIRGGTNILENNHLINA